MQTINSVLSDWLEKVCCFSPLAAHRAQPVQSSPCRVARPRSGPCRVLRDILNVKALVGVFYREKGLLSDCENFANGSFAALPGIKSVHCLAAGCPTLLNLNLPPRLLTRDIKPLYNTSKSWLCCSRIYPNFDIDLHNIETPCHK